MKVIILPQWGELTDAQVAAKLGCTRQAVAYARRRSAGLCERCSSPAIDGHRLCLTHSVAVAQTRRKRLGSKAWVAGGRGRPPK